MAQRKGPPRSGGFASTGVGGEAPYRFRTLSRDGWADVVFAFHDEEEIGPRMMARIAKTTGLQPRDL